MEPAALLTERRLAEFELVRVLGQGGSGIVYEARHGTRRVALKVLRKDLALSSRDTQRFVEEANRMARVDHAGLVKLDSAGILPDGRPYIAMQFLDGETLAARLVRGPLAPEDAVRSLGVLARAVASLHAAGFIHRDIKPENVVMVGHPASTPVLLDFGIAREIDRGPSTTTASGAVRGTPAYMAPERLFGSPASVRSDVYELAVTFHMMLVGRLPWRGVDDVAERLAPRSPAELGAAVPVDLARAILRALSTRPEVRPEGADAFAREVELAWEARNAPARFEAVTEDLAPRIDPYGPTMHDANEVVRSLSIGPSARDGDRRRRRLATFGSIAVFAALAALGALALRSPPPSPAERVLATWTYAPPEPVAATPPPTASPQPSTHPIVPAAGPSASARTGATAKGVVKKANVDRENAGAPADVAPAAATTAATLPASDPFLEDRR